MGWVIVAVVEAPQIEECWRADREEGGGVVIDVQESYLSVVLLQDLQIIAATESLQNLPVSAAAFMHLLLSTFRPGAAAENLCVGMDLGVLRQFTRYNAEVITVFTQGALVQTEARDVLPERSKLADRADQRIA